METHAGPTPTDEQIAERGKPEKTPFNETQLRRPWSPLWACALSEANGPITLIAEGILGLCLVENGYEMCTEKGERSMFKGKSALLPVVIDQFYASFTRCAAALGFTVRGLKCSDAQ